MSMERERLMDSGPRTILGGALKDVFLGDSRRSINIGPNTMAPGKVRRWCGRSGWGGI